VIAQTRAELRQQFEAKIAMLEARIKDLELQAELNQKFHELELRLDARQQARDEAKRGSEIIPQRELLAKFEGLQRQIDDLKGVSDLDARFRDLAERRR